MADLVTQLLPVLSRSLEAPFNVFDVMHHGTHEKQLSNVFGWLLNTDGSHRLGDAFLRIFIDEVNRDRPLSERLPVSDYLVMQEVNTSGLAGEGQDIADLVLTNDHAVIVVENYYTSDGHGHSYRNYLKYSQQDEGRMGAVVLLCQDHDSSRQTDGWEKAAVVTYGRVVDRLWSAVKGDRTYQVKHPEPYSFIGQMHRKFVEGRGPMQDQEALEFIVAMCETGEAGRYAEQKHGPAAERFANDVAVQARERFGEGRELLMRVKHRLTTYGNEHLKKQLNSTLGEGSVSQASARYVGNYRWTVNLSLTARDLPTEDDFGEDQLQIKFGPSAWYAIEKDPHWTLTVDPEVADYSRLFITRARTREVRQSQVSLHEVLDGLAPDDLRLCDELVQILGDR
jgi:hypothetical protein